MALSWNETLAAVNGGRPVHGAYGRSGRGVGMGSYGLGSSKARGMALQEEGRLLGERLRSEFPERVAQANRVIGRLRDLSARAASVAGTVPEAQVSAREIADEVEAIEERLSMSEQAFNAAVQKVLREFPQGGWPHIWEPVQATMAAIDDVQARAAAAEATAKRSLSKIESVARERSQVDQVQQQQQQATVNYELERLKYEAEQRRLEQEARVQQEQLRWDREERARQAEREYQDRLAAERAARESAIVQQEAARQAAEMQFQQSLLQMEQERALREEERRAAREDQEQLMQQLMMLQQMGINPLTGQPAGAQMPGMPPGVPAGFSPPGAFMTPGYGQMLPAGVTAPQQGFAPPGYAPPGYAPQAWSQSQGVMPASAQSAPGFEFVSFNPAAEMFGMGAANVPVANPTLRGSLIEDGYAVYGPSADPQNRPYYTFESPDGRTWTAWANAVIGPRSAPVKDPKTGRVIYAPPPGGVAQEEPTDYGQVSSFLRDIIGGGVSVYKDVRETKAREKAISRGLLPADGGAPPMAAAPGRLPSWVAPVGLGVVAIGVVSALMGGKGKSRK